MTRKEQSAAFLRPFLAIEAHPFRCGIRIENTILGGKLCAIKRRSDRRNAMTKRWLTANQKPFFGKQSLFVPTKKYSPLYFVPKFSGLCEAFYHKMTAQAKPRFCAAQPNLRIPAPQWVKAAQVLIECYFRLRRRGQRPQITERGARRQRATFVNFKEEENL